MKTPTNPFCQRRSTSQKRHELIEVMNKLQDAFNNLSPRVETKLSILFQKVESLTCLSLL